VIGVDSVDGADPETVEDGAEERLVGEEQPVVAEDGVDEVEVAVADLKAEPM